MFSPYDRPGTFKRPFQPPRAAACGRPASRRCAAGHHRPWIGWPPRPDSARWRLRRRSSPALRSSSATRPGRARQHTLASISMPNTRFRRCAGATCAAHRTTGRTRAACSGTPATCRGHTRRSAVAGIRAPGCRTAEIYRHFYRQSAEHQHWRGFAGDSAKTHLSRSIEDYRLLGRS